MIKFLKCPGCGRWYVKWWWTVHKPFCDQLCMRVREKQVYHGWVTDRAKMLAQMARSAEYKRRIKAHEDAGKHEEADQVVREYLDLMNRPENIENTGGAL